MAATEQTEIERKYDIDEAARVPDLTVVEGVAAVEPLTPFTLSAVYFDTESLDLAAHNISLRRREGGSDEGWHLKKPVDEGRTELHWPLDTPDDPVEPGDEPYEGIQETVPSVILEPVRAIVRGRSLSPIARLTTTRTAVHLMNERGEAVAELADDQVLASDVRGGEYRTWREWELELLPAAPETREERTAFLDTVERALTAAGAHPSESRSKLAHTLGADSLADVRGRRTGTAALLVPPALTDAGSAGSVVVAALGHQTALLVGWDAAVRAEERDAVHQMRRTVRRIRSLLASHSDLFEQQPLDMLRGELKWMGAALGEARDAEVRRDRAAKLLDKLQSHDPFVEQRLVGSEQQEYDEALGRLRKALGGERYFRMLDGLDGFVSNPPLTERAAAPAEEEITASLRNQVKRMRGRADAVLGSKKDGEAAGSNTAGSNGGSALVESANREAALHEVRKAARRLRYGVTALKVPGSYAPPGKVRRIAAAVKPVEKALGGHRDRMLFDQQVRLSAQRARAQGEDTFVYGLLSGASVNPAEPAATSGQSPTAKDDPLLHRLASALRRVEKLARKL